VVRNEEISSILKRKIINLLEEEKKKNFYKEEDINKLLQCYERCFPKPKESIKYKGEPTMTPRDQERWNKDTEYLVKGSKFEKGQHVIANIKDVGFPATIYLIDNYSKPYQYLVEIDKKLSNYDTLQLLTGEYSKTRLVNERDIIRADDKQYKKQIGIVEKISKFRKKQKNIKMPTPRGAEVISLEIGSIICVPRKTYSKSTELSDNFPKCGKITDIDPIKNIITVSFITASNLIENRKYDFEELRNAIIQAKQSKYYESALYSGNFGVGSRRGGKRKKRTKKKLYKLKKNKKKSYKVKKNRKKSAKKKKKRKGFKGK